MKQTKPEAISMAQRLLRFAHNDTREISAEKRSHTNLRSLRFVAMTPLTVNR
ncbi:hypothetical protein PN499_28375 [Kamptonema animale CS-326]|uniref:hypothetical protein n=1 Tax=Kamptonema animale TaxID=92934 RepID=UPI00232BAE56|nr:hypothetical protein [Kamptonema animale]MDB9515122.1 hypothetical protein [Kamptonema animale CS-326]